MPEKKQLTFKDIKTDERFTAFNGFLYVKISYKVAQDRVTKMYIKMNPETSVELENGNE